VNSAKGPFTNDLMNEAYDLGRREYRDILVRGMLWAFAGGSVCGIIVHSLVLRGVL
jgi:hypothetical protein